MEKCIFDEVASYLFSSHLAGPHDTQRCQAEPSQHPTLMGVMRLGLTYHMSPTVARSHAVMDSALRPRSMGDVGSGVRSGICQTSNSQSH